MNIGDIFSNALNNVKNKFGNRSASGNAYDRLEQGGRITLKPESDRYTYENQQDTQYNKKWKPETKEEQETLSPKGYYRQGERENVKQSLYSDIFDSALRKAKSDDAKRVQDLKDSGQKARKTNEKTLEQNAKAEADETFKDNYREKQIAVPSTAIKVIDYDPETEELNVKFTSGNKKYFYPAVPLELIQAWLKAPSKGEFFMKNIHDQYSMYGSNHGKKGSKEQKAIKRYQKAYKKTNKGKWK